MAPVDWSFCSSDRTLWETAEVTDRALSVYVDRDTQLSFQTY
mgnify:CR=1 FL=1